MTGRVRDDPAGSRYLLEEDGETAFAAYHRDGDVLVFTHTVVPDAVAGRGIGTALVAGALPTCGRAACASCPHARSSPPSSTATRNMPTFWSEPDRVPCFDVARHERE